MNTRALLLAALATAGWAAGVAAEPQVPAPTAPPAPPVGEMKALGKDRYQIGRILIDKKAGRFTVPGRVHVLDRPLEYLATTPGGMKEYETLLEVDATGSEFNLACILLGLERDPTLQPFFQFSEKPLAGPRVRISVAWQDGRKRRQISAVEALLESGPDAQTQPVEWVYTGSVLSPADGQFAADVAGTLVGFVHDPNSVIEATTGLGIGAYGSVNGNAAVLPPVGSPIELIVELPKPGAGKSSR
jgi:hypothetical protein